jgi:hypothetical protein
MQAPLAAARPRARLVHGRFVVRMFTLPAIPRAAAKIATPIKFELLYIVSIALFQGILARLVGFGPISFSGQAPDHARPRPGTPRGWTLTAHD